MARAKAGGANHVAQIVSDPANPPDTVLIAGYPGASPFEGYERLYFTPDLSNWVDIPKDDVLHQAPVPGDSFGAVYVWIRKGSALLFRGQQPPADDSSGDGGDGDDGTGDDGGTGESGT